MDQHTFRSRLAQLIQKSRKALRLYSSLGKAQQSSADDQGELSDVQVQEWREVNGELLRSLSSAIGRVSVKEVAVDVYTLRDRFQVAWRTHESELATKQRQLISSSEKGDFIKAAILARELVTLRARVQASHAAYQELDMLFGQSSAQHAPVELSSEQVVTAAEQDDQVSIPDQHALITAELKRLGTAQQRMPIGEGEAPRPAKVLRFRKVS